MICALSSIFRIRILNCLINMVFCWNIKFVEVNQDHPLCTILSFSTKSKIVALSSAFIYLTLVLLVLLFVRRWLNIVYFTWPCFWMALHVYGTASSLVFHHIKATTFQWPSKNQGGVNWAKNTPKFIWLLHHISNHVKLTFTWYKLISSHPQNLTEMFVNFVLVP